MHFIKINGDKEHTYLGLGNSDLQNVGIMSLITRRAKS